MTPFSPSFVLLAAIDVNDPLFLTAIATLVFVIVCLIYVLTRPKGKDQKKEQDRKSLESPKGNLLEDREVLDGPVEISDDMSLAEIKRLKSARIRSKSKAKRANALEATEASKRYHEEVASMQSEASLVEEVEEKPGKSEEREEEKKKEESKFSKGVSNDSLAELRRTGAFKFPVPTVNDPAVEAALSKKSEPVQEVTDAGVTHRDRNSATEASKTERSEETARSVSDPEVSGKSRKEEIAARSLEDGLAKTRSGFIERLSGLFKKDRLDDDIVNEVEEILYTADIGPKAASRIMEAIEEELNKDAKQDPAVVWKFVRGYVQDLLLRRQTPIDLDSSKPFVFLMIGVNGVGKTTTIGKLASKFRQEGKSVLMVAGDTFRAAAVEQLEVWGERTGIEVYKGTPEQDPASVIYEGIEKAAKEGIDIVICDTAGRLQSNTNLLDELGKIGRVAGKVVDGAPHETMLVLDANTGQNALLQARKFNEAVNITGIVLTKLDGTAKGGIILGICDEIDVPIRYIGIGEAVEDLRPFKADEFVEALFM